MSWCHGWQEATHVQDVLSRITHVTRMSRSSYRGAAKRCAEEQLATVSIKQPVQTDMNFAYIHNFFNTTWKKSILFII